MNYKEGDIVIGKVVRVEPTAVFVELAPGHEGAMVMSEVAAGRIRNLREYVFVNKQIVCKILQINKDHIQLSLRRVTGKEREEAQERFKKERTLMSVCKSILKDAKKVLDKIELDIPLADFYDQVKENPERIKPYVTKEEAEKMIAALKTKEDGKKVVKKTFTLTTTSETGLTDIKNVLTSVKASIAYLGSSKFTLSVEDKEFKQAHAKALTLLEQIAKKAKDAKMHYALKE